MENKFKESNSLIPIKNIYYMLSYAFQVLNTSNFQKIKGEKFENILTTKKYEDKFS